MRKEQRIELPRVGMVIQEDDPRVDLAKRIVDIKYNHNGAILSITARAGRDGRGRRSQIALRRLEAGHYRLLSEPKLVDVDV